jgi:hypothetical protein
MNYDEKLDLILTKLEAIAPSAPVPVPTEPAILADFVRPFPVEPRHGAGTRMNAPDEKELILRARYGVRWNGDVMSHIEDEAWAEINALKAGDPLVTKVYAETGIDPTLAAVLLLTGYLEPMKHDQYSLGIAQANRRAKVHQTPQSWIADMFAIMRGQPIVSGGDAPE